MELHIRNKRRILTLAALAGLSITAMSANAFAQELSPVVQMSKGTIEGVKNDGYLQFKGIPYAKAPVGSLRWMPPVEEEKWSGTLKANHFANTCATKLTLGGFGPVSAAEDCLYLNVYTPAVLPENNSKLPVMVWIPGGGLGSGSGNEYDASKLVSKNVIVVTMNYRLGMFGYFSHPALNHEGHKAINYGTLDQQAALKWVNKNIQSFGGDNHNVTLFGESAGGHSVLAQMASPGAKGLFNRAIVSSGSFSLKQPTVAEATKIGELVAKNVGCSEGTEEKMAECLRAVPTETILDKGVNYMTTAQVVTDGEVMPESLEAAFSSGRYNVVPIINGFNTNEGTFFAAMMELDSGKPIDNIGFYEGLKAFFGESDANTLIKRAAIPAKQVNLGQDYADFFGRAKFICRTPMMNNLLAKNTPVYSYEFADKTAPQFAKPVSFPYAAAHTSDLQYIFRDFHGTTGELHKLNPAQEKLSILMVDYWTNFAKTGNPNAKGLPVWGVYHPQTESTLYLHTQNTKMIEGISKTFNCDEFAGVL